MRKDWRTRLGGVLVCALMLAGCARAHVVQVPPLQAPVACQTVVPERDVLAGVSLSGGGSRAGFLRTLAPLLAVPAWRRGSAQAVEAERAAGEHLVLRLGGQ
jgi:hypothetical protein